MYQSLAARANDGVNGERAYSSSSIILNTPPSVSLSGFCLPIVASCPEHLCAPVGSLRLCLHTLPIGLAAACMMLMVFCAERRTTATNSNGGGAVKTTLSARSAANHQRGDATACVCVCACVCGHGATNAHACTCTERTRAHKRRRDAWLDERVFDFVHTQSRSQRCAVDTGRREGAAHAYAHMHTPV